MIASRHNETAAAVEKAIRNVISIAWENNNKDFTTIIKGIVKRPSNSKIIAIIKDIVLYG